MIPLSASRISCLKECSWLYHANYILNIPRTHNEGSCRGDIVHYICEELSKPENKKRFDAILENNSFLQDEIFLKEAKKRLSDNNFLTEENITLIDKMLLNALKYDFFGKDIKNLKNHYSELCFDEIIEVEEEKFRVRGFIDKLFIYDKNKALIRDFKTSKSVYKGEELENNIQDLMYRMAVKKLFPEIKDISLEFLFLKFNLKEKGYILMQKVSNAELIGAKYELLDIAKFLDNFSIDDAHSNFAAAKGFPTDGSFGGIMKCGKPYRQTKNKQTGEWELNMSTGKKQKSYICSARLPFDYYALTDQKGNIIPGTSVFPSKLEQLKKQKKKDQKIKLFHYEGCPYWRDSDKANGFSDDPDLRLDMQ